MGIFQYNHMSDFLIKLFGTSFEHALLIEQIEFRKETLKSADWLPKWCAFPS